MERRQGEKGSGDDKDDDNDDDDDDSSHRPVVSSHSTGCTVAPPTPDGRTIKEDIILLMMIYDMGRVGEERKRGDLLNTLLSSWYVCIKYLLYSTTLATSN